MTYWLSFSSAWLNRPILPSKLNQRRIGTREKPKIAEKPPQVPQFASHQAANAGGGIAAAPHKRRATILPGYPCPSLWPGDGR